MRLFGHPIHVMLIHFPIALWPAHAALHVFASFLPAGASAQAGFWLLAAGTLLGWCAMFFGASDLLAYWTAGDRVRVKLGLIHGGINGTVALGFTALLGLEYLNYPKIVHDVSFLVVEGALLVFMLVGNYFGGELVWPKKSRIPEERNANLR